MTKYHCTTLIKAHNIFTEYIPFHYRYRYHISNECKANLKRVNVEVDARLDVERDIVLPDKKDYVRTQVYGGPIVAVYYCKRRC